MKLLLHACCGPCSLEPVRLLQAAGHDIAIYYTNSNIAPREEYAHRLATLEDWAKSEGIPVIEGPYDPATWEEAAGRIGDAALAIREEARTRPSAGCIGARVAAEQTLRADDAGQQAARRENQPAAADRAKSGRSAPADRISDPYEDASLRADVLSVDPTRREARCRACYRLRLEETARVAAEQGFDGIGTTLSVSPYQYTQIIEQEVRRAAEREGIEGIFEDFRPYYDEATRRSRAIGMYRQNYCGCRISDEEAAAERAERKAQRAAAKQAERAEHAAEIAAAEAELEKHRADRAAYDKKQARKRAILKSLREQAKQEVSE